MFQDPENPSAKALLDELRSEYGDSNFGYRVQGLMAHVLLRCGCEILAVNAQGHPDILARLGDTRLLVQVKSTAHRGANANFELGAEDLQGITPRSHEAGYLAVLDCAEPVSWILVRHDRLRPFLGRPVHLATLRAESDVPLSADCTEAFLEIMSSSGARLRNVGFAILASRALRGRPL